MCGKIGKGDGKWVHTRKKPENRDFFGITLWTLDSLCVCVCETIMNKYPYENNIDTNNRVSQFIDSFIYIACSIWRSIILFKSCDKHGETLRFGNKCAEY